jgi:tyrosine-protein phosphatase YwqE
MWLLSNKTTIKDSGLLNGFCDMHSHLLPGVDDGVTETHETLQILEKCEEMGVDTIWLTPHIMEDIPNTTNLLRKEFNQLSSKYRGKIKLKLAAENMIDNLLSSRMAQKDFLHIGDRQKHLLVETSYFNPPIDMEGRVDNIMRLGYVPILAHPERYQYMDISDYRKWKKRGILFQLNLPSIIGAYGVEVKKKAEILLERGMYDLCGTDTHTLRFMEFFFVGKIKKKYLKQLEELNQWGLSLV